MPEFQALPSAWDELSQTLLNNLNDKDRWDQIEALLDKNDYTMLSSERYRAIFNTYFGEQHQYF